VRFAFLKLTLVGQIQSIYSQIATQSGKRMRKPMTHESTFKVNKLKMKQGKL
jgi:hypothetical protein